MEGITEKSMCSNIVVESYMFKWPKTRACNTYYNF